MVSFHPSGVPHLHEISEVVGLGYEAPVNGYSQAQVTHKEFYHLKTPTQLRGRPHGLLLWCGLASPKMVAAGTKSKSQVRLS